MACSPQAWAAGAVFLLLDACLGLQVHASERRVVLSRPFLPEFLEKVTIRRLRIGDATVDLSFIGHHENVEVNLLRRQGSLDVVILK